MEAYSIPAILAPPSYLLLICIFFGGRVYRVEMNIHIIVFLQRLFPHGHHPIGDYTSLDRLLWQARRCPMLADKRKLFADLLPSTPVATIFSGPLLDEPNTAHYSSGLARALSSSLSDLGIELPHNPSTLYHSYGTQLLLNHIYTVCGLALPLPPLPPLLSLSTCPNYNANSHNQISNPRN